MNPLAFVVDDAPHIRRVAELVLRSIQCEVVTACDGEEAWDLLQTRCPDILVTDLQMPNMDGIQLVRLIRESEFSDLPVVLLTAKGFELSQYSSDLIKTCSVIGKPFSPAALGQHVYGVLSSRVFS